MVLKNNKKHQSLGNINVGVGEDKISCLPVELIHRILSFLQTKCAMSTCILSKRWKYVSNSIPTLDFRRSQWLFVNCIIEPKRLKQMLMNFSDTVIYIHEKPKILKFYLHWDDDFDEDRVRKWINIVVKRKVEELLLSGNVHTNFESPLSYFTCDSLTVLDLRRARFNFPDTVRFPKLKIFRLKLVSCVDRILTKQLHLNCPILEELSLKFCDSEKDICIENVALKNLCIRTCHFGGSKMKVCAPNLTNICYIAHMPAEFECVLDSFPLLTEADIDIFCDDKFVLIKFFEMLSNVKLLKMSLISFQALILADIQSTDLPEFDNLINLEVGPADDLGIVGSEYVEIVTMILRFLHRTHNLESIVFEGIYVPKEEEEDEDYDCWSVDPKCSLLHLKSITFKDFEGEPVELDAIKLFLKYAGILDTVTLVASRRLSRSYKAQAKAMRQLLLFPRPINCVVKFLLYSENI